MAFLSPRAATAAMVPPAPVDYRSAPDRALLAWAGERDDEACFELVSRYGERLLSMIERTHGDLQLSEDIVQDALFRAIERHQQLRDGAAVFPWLVRIALRRAVDYRRKARRELLVDMLSFGERRLAVPSAEDARIDADRERARVHEALARLKPYHRELLVLRYFSQLTVAEMAEVYGTSNASVRKDLQRARGQMERRLPERFGEES